MTRGNARVSSGLVFLGIRDIDIVRAGNLIGTTFETLRQQVEGARILSETTARISTLHHHVRLVLHPECKIQALSGRSATFLSVRIVRRANPQASKTLSCELALAHLLRALNRLFFADYIKCPGPQGYVEGEEFMRSTERLDQPGRLFHSVPAQTDSPTGQTALTSQLIDQSIARLARKIQTTATRTHTEIRQKLQQQPRDIPQRRILTAKRRSFPRLRLSTWMYWLVLAGMLLPLL